MPDLSLLKLFCSECNRLVDAPPPRRAVSRRTTVRALCGHKIKVRLIPFSEAREGVEVCLNESIGHYQAAVTLFKADDYAHALFMVLTGYEEMAKCSRILDAAHFSSRMSMKSMVVEDSVFYEHESKYQITMNYLDEWLPSLNEIRLTFMKGVRSIDPPKQKASRKRLFRHGFKIRNACLYVDYRKGWLSTQKVSKNEVLRNLGMLANMMGGFRSSLTNWSVALS